jgi:hypothetical protein
MKHEPSLRHYWPIADATNDLISERNLYSQNPTLVSDRFGRPYAAFQVADDSSFMSAPPTAPYFGEQFALMLWVKVDSLMSGFQLDLINFGFFNGQNNVAVQITHSNHKIHHSVSRDNWWSWNGVRDETELKIGEWYHLAFVEKMKKMSIYINGLFVCLDDSLEPRADMNRTANYIGKNCPCSLKEFKVANFDDLKIFDRALSAEEVFAHFKLTRSYIVEV